MTLLTGCAWVRPEPLAPVVVRPVCPTLAEYSPAFQTAVVEVLDQYPDGHPIRVWSEDYIGVRDQIRECRSAR